MMLNCQIVMCDMFTNSVSTGFSVSHATESPVLTELANTSHITICQHGSHFLVFIHQFESKHFNFI